MNEDADDEASAAALLGRQLLFVREHVPHDARTEHELLSMCRQANEHADELGIADEAARCRWAVLVAMTNGEICTDRTMRRHIAGSGEPDAVVMRLYAAVW